MAYDIGTARGIIELGYNGRGIRQAQADLGSFSKTGTKAANAVGGALIGGGAAALTFVSALAIGIRTVGNFEQGLSNIAAVSGATGDELDALRAKALQLGADTTFSATDAAAAMEELVKAGLSVDEVLNGAADAAVALAAAGGIDIPQAATIASNAMNQFNLTAADLAGVVDDIAGAANASAIDVGDLGQSLQQVGAVAHLSGLSFKDTATAIALMGNAGIRGSDAGTSLKTMLQNLNPVTTKQINLFKQLGLLTEDGANQFFDAQGNVKSYAEISGVLAKALEGQTNQQKLANLEIIFGTDAIRAAAVAAEAGADGVKAMNEEMGKTTAAEVAAKRMDNFSGSLEQLKGSIETAIITGGSGALVVLRRIVDVITELVNSGTELGNAMGKELGPALDDVGGIIENLINAGVSVYNVFDDIIGLLAKLTFGAVVAVFTVLADILEKVTSLVEDQGTVIAIVAGTWVVMANGGIALVISKLGYFAAYAVIQALGGLEALRAGAVQTTGSLKTLSASAASAASSLAAVALLVLAVQTWQAYKKAVEETTAALEGADKAKTSSNFTGIQEEIDKIKALMAERQKLIDQQAEVAARGNVFEKAWKLPDSFKAGEFKDSMDDLQAAADDLEDSLIGLGDNLTSLAQEFGVIDPTKAEDLMDALASGDPQALTDLNNLLAEMQPLLDEAGISSADFIKILNGAGDISMDQLRFTLQNVARDAGSTEGATQSLADAASQLSNEAKDAASAAKELDDALNNLIGVELSADEAAIQWRDSLRTLREEIGKTNGQITGNSEVADANRSLVIDSIRTLLERISTEAKAGASNKRLSRIFQEGRKSLIDNAVAAGADRDEMKLLLRQYHLTQGSVKALTGSIRDSAKGTEEHTAKVKDLKARIAELKPKAVNVTAPGAKEARDEIQKLRDQIALLKGKQIVIDVIRKISGVDLNPFSGGGGGSSSGGTDKRDPTNGLLGGGRSGLASGIPPAPAAPRSASGGGARGGLRVVSGELRLDDSGRAYISGVAAETGDDGEAFDDLIGRMN